MEAVLVVALAALLGMGEAVAPDITQLDASPEAELAKTGDFQTPQGEDTPRPVHAPAPKLLEPLPPDGDVFLEDSETQARTAALAHGGLEDHEVEKRKEPENVRCYDALIKKIAATQAKYDHHKATSKAERAALIETDGSMRGWKKKLAEEKTVTAGSKSILNEVHVKWKTKHAEAEKVYAVADKKLSTYHSERRMVTIDASRAKEAFTEYMKYKEQAMEAGADDSTIRTDAESQEYHKMAQESLSSYHASLAQMQSRRTLAEKVRQQYNTQSKLYHNISETCDALGQVIANRTVAYHQAKGKRDHASQEFDNAERAFVGHSMAYREQLGRSQQEMEMLKIEQKARLDAKRRYWELYDMEKKYEDLGDKLTHETKLLARRHDIKSSEATRLQGDIQSADEELTDLKQKQSAAQSAADSFSADYEKAGCGPAKELMFMAGRVTSDSTYMASAPEKGSTAVADTASDTQTSDTENKEKTSDAALSKTEEKKEESVYEGFYKDFLGKYKQTVKEADKLQAKSKRALGDAGYTDCQYYTKLVSMYTDLSYQNLRFKDWIEDNGDMKQPKELKKALTVQQKAALNDARAAHFKTRMQETCHGAEHAARVQKEQGLRGGAASSRRSAMEFLQLSARAVAQTAEQQRSKIEAKKDDATTQEAKNAKKLAAYCGKQRDLTSASLSALQSLSLAQHKQELYLKMARAMQEEAASDGEDAANRRKMLERKIRDYAEYEQEAAAARSTPCTHDV